MTQWVSLWFYFGVCTCAIWFCLWYQCYIYCVLRVFKITGIISSWQVPKNINIQTIIFWCLWWWLELRLLLNSQCVFTFFFCFFCVSLRVYAQSLSRVWLCNRMDCSLPGSSVHGIVLARTLEWVAISSSRGSCWPRGWTSSPVSPALPADSLPLSHLGSPCVSLIMYVFLRNKAWCLDF